MSNKIGLMKWDGMRTSSINTTYSGVEFDVAKSALQKYIRRGITEKALLVAVEIYRLKEVGGDAAVSNLCNRLALIAVEDVGAANLSLVTDVVRVLEDGARDLPTILAIVQLLCLSDKTRMMSHCWRAYATKEGRTVSTAAGIALDISFTPEDIVYVQRYKNCQLFMSGDSDNLQWYALMFLKRMQERDLNAFSWAHFYLEASVNVTVARRRKFITGNSRNVTGKPDIILWKMLSTVLPPNVHDTLVSAYYNHAENRPFLQCAILAALYNTTYTPTSLLTVAITWQTNEEMTKMVRGDYQLVVDDYVIDKHTRLGRLQHKTIKDFVEEGAVVHPQSTLFYNEQLAELYKRR